MRDEDDELGFQDPETVMRDARIRFVEAFPGRVRSMAMLFDSMGGADGGDPSHSASRRMAHQMAGIAGTLGFPSVSAKASDLEQLLVAASLGQGGIGAADIERALGALSESFSSDKANPAPSWAHAPEHAAGPHILLVEGAGDHRKIVTAWLRSAGYQVAATGDGREAFTQARIDRPAAVILDLDLAGADAHAICRKIKVSPDLANTPVIFTMASAAGRDRITAAPLGADDYLIKPFDQSELTRRLAFLINAHTTAPAGPPDGFLTYEAFALAAQDLLRRHAIALALVRLPNGYDLAIAKDIAAAARRSDLIAMLNANHVVWLFVGGSESAARSSVETVAKNWPDLRAGISAAAAPATKSLEALLAEADT